MGEEHINSNLNNLQTKLSQKENPINLFTNKWSQNQLLKDLDQKVKQIQTTFEEKLEEISLILKEQIIACSKQMEELKNVTEIILQGDEEQLLTVQDKFNIIHEPQQDFLNDLKKQSQALDFLVKYQEEIFKILNEFISNEFIDKIRNREKLITYKSIAPQDSSTQMFYHNLNFDKHTTDTFKIGNEEQIWISNFLFQTKFTLKLLFRGSRDGFTAQAFHQKCDNQGPTFTLIKSEHNKVFGGYTSQSWNQSENYTSDDQAFIFSLTNFTQHQVTRKTHAIYNISTYLCTFGGGYDIYICSSCNSSNSSNTNFPHSYKHTESNNENTKKYLAGAYNFKVIEIETYSVIT